MAALEMLAEAGLAIDQPDENGKTSPLEEAASHGQLEAVQWLLNHGASVEGIDRPPCSTPLIAATMEGKLDIARVLIDHGAGVNAWYSLGKGKSQTKFSALTWAMANGHVEIAELLRRHGAVLPTVESPSDEPPRGLREEIVENMSEHAGPVDALSLVEIVLSDIPIDIHVVRPTPERQSIILFTTGMSEVAMTVPEGSEAYRYAEAYIELPPHWPLTAKAMKDKSRSWPIELLRRVARYPHEHDMWLEEWRIISNGDPPESFAPDTELCCAMVLRMPDYGQMIAYDGRLVNFYQVLPMYREERDYCLEKGTEAFGRLLGNHNIDTQIDPRRVNVAKEGEKGR